MAKKLTSKRTACQERKYDISLEDVMDHLNLHVQNQQKAKQAIAIALQRQVHRAQGAKVSKLNTLLHGNTGTGKTHIIRTACEFVELPYYRFSLTGKSGAGYVGENFVDVFKTIRKGHPFAVVHLDEIDKIAMREGSDMEEDVQDELIPIIEGTRVYNRETDNLLFLFTGAFVGIDQIAQRRQGKSIGFHYSPTSLPVQIREEDFVTFGLKPELVGRFTQIVATHSLTCKDYYAIINKKTGVFATTRKYLYNQFGRSIRLTKGAKAEVIQFCRQQESGARSLDKACALLFHEHELGGGPDILTKDYALRVLYS